MSDFERKIKYGVFKIKDAQRYLTEIEEAQLNTLLESIERRKVKHEGKYSPDYLVFDSNLDCYQEAWLLIEKEISGKCDAETPSRFVNVSRDVDNLSALHASAKALEEQATELADRLRFSNAIVIDHESD